MTSYQLPDSGWNKIQLYLPNENCKDILVGKNGKAMEKEQISGFI